MAAPIKFLSGRQQQQKIGVEGSTQNEKVLEVVGQVGIGTTIFDTDASLTVRGDAKISGNLDVGDIGLENLNISGISTFNQDVDVLSMNIINLTCSRPVAVPNLTRNQSY